MNREIQDIVDETIKQSGLPRGLVSVLLPDTMLDIAAGTAMPEAVEKLTYKVRELMLRCAVVYGIAVGSGKDPAAAISMKFGMTGGDAQELVTGLKGFDV